MEQSANFSACRDTVQLLLRDRSGIPGNGVRADVYRGRESARLQARRIVLRDSPVAATTAGIRIKIFISFMFTFSPFSRWSGILC